MRASREESKQSRTSQSSMRLKSSRSPGRLCRDEPEMPVSDTTRSSTTRQPSRAAYSRQWAIWSAGESADCLSVLMRA
ncbi:MAG: hypothetical protein CL938_03590 [Deltaproteobacteria bacterium]|nr:hypothetical protein [Deltaproteobacteria bacterium]